MGDIRVYMGVVLAVYICHVVYGRQDATSTNIAYAGSTVTIDCPLTGSYRDPVWRGPPDLMVYTRGSSILPAVSDRISWAANQRDLILTGVTTADTDAYECIDITGGLFKVGLHTLHVRVLPNLPTISNTETIGGVLSVRGTERQPLSLTCVCRDGFPAPTLAWYRNRVTSTPVASTTPPDSNATSVTVTYQFTPVRNDDNVTYICQSSFQHPQPDPINQTAVQLYLNCAESASTDIGPIVGGFTTALVVVVVVAVVVVVVIYKKGRLNFSEDTP